MKRKKPSKKIFCLLLVRSDFGNFVPFEKTKLLKPFHKRQILESSKLRKFADDNFKFQMVESSSNW